MFVTRITASICFFLALPVVTLNFSFIPAYANEVDAFDLLDEFDSYEPCVKCAEPIFDPAKRQIVLRVVGSIEN